ncbi:MAG TPA: transporter substrate-binding domain-containing protein [bacterium]|nr:transporter substrate-binding domain-containing protein [bacterium]
MWQKKIDDMKKNRSFKEYYKKAYPDFDYFIPDILQLVTEDYPPITFEKNGKMSGVAVEIVEEIIKRLNMPNNIKLMYWDDAYQMALINPNVILFSTTRTEKRENLFHWLGPIGSYNDNLYVKKGSGLKAESLDDAKKFKSIGTVNGWFSQELLQKENFQNLSKTPSPVECAKWLFDGTVEAGVFTDMTAPDIFNKAGFSIDDLEKILSLKKYEFYVSISKGTPEKTIELWRETFDEMKRDGTLREILKRWIP